jgi:hypothetical protein
LPGGAALTGRAAGRVASVLEAVTRLGDEPRPVPVGVGKGGARAFTFCEANMAVQREDVAGGQ